MGVPFVERRIAFTNRSGKLKTAENEGSKKTQGTNQVAISTEFAKVARIGTGLVNTGVSCYINSVLQSLFYSPSLANLMHSTSPCHKCTFCLLSATYLRHKKAAAPFCPKNVIQSISGFAKHLRPTRQHDAHEFLSFLLDKLQSDVARSHNSQMINQIFQGSLLSQVTCLNCHNVSETVDPFLNLPLDVLQCRSLSQALSAFTAPEFLDKKNQYKCDACKKLSRAKKQMRLLGAPHQFIIQLKRFDLFGRKVNKFIEFPTFVNIDTCERASDNKVTEKPTKYMLYSVLVHAGSSVHSGHYYSYVKGENGVWYCMDDEVVRTVKESEVLHERAYMLFYRKACGASTAPVTKKEKVPATLAKKPSKDTPEPVSSESKPLPENSIKEKSMEERMVKHKRKLELIKQEEVLPSPPVSPPKQVLTKASLLKSSSEPTVTVFNPADSNNSNVINHLYDAPVGGWNDENLVREEVVTRKKHKRPDSYDVEYDAGRQKKVKKKQEFGQNAFSRHNQPVRKEKFGKRARRGQWNVKSI